MDKKLLQSLIEYSGSKHGLSWSISGEFRTDNKLEIKIAFKSPVVEEVYIKLCETNEYNKGILESYLNESGSSFRKKIKLELKDKWHLIESEDYPPEQQELKLVFTERMFGGKEFYFLNGTCCPEFVKTSDEQINDLYPKDISLYAWNYLERDLEHLS